MNKFANYTSAETFAKIVDYKNVSEMWTHSVATYPDNIALVDGENITYKQLDEEVCKMRSALKERGIEKGDRVGMLIPNSAAFAKTFLAITTLGAVAVLLPPHLDAMTVFGCSLKFALKGLVYSATLQEKTTIATEKNPKLSLIEDTACGQEATPCVDIEGEAPCAILFTGGTTAKSKGALLSQRADLLLTIHIAFLHKK